MIITIIWMIVGVGKVNLHHIYGYLGFYSFTIGLLASVLAHIDYKAQKLQKKKAIMNEFCKEKKISKVLKDKLKTALEYNFLKNCFIWAVKKEYDVI